MSRPLPPPPPEATMTALLIPLLLFALQVESPPPPVGLDPAAAHFEAGRAALVGGDLGLALEHLGAALRLAPGEPDLRRLYARALSDAGRPAAALEALDPESPPPPSAWAALERGRALHDLGRDAEAESAFELALVSYEAFGEARLALAGCLIDASRVAEARPLLVRLRADAPSEPRVILADARWLEGQAGPVEASVRLATALAGPDAPSGPASIRMRLALARLEQAQAHTTEAWRAVEPLLDLDLSADVLVRLSRFAADSGHMVDALAALGAALVKDPTGLAALAELTALLDGDTDLVAAVASRRLEAAPDDPRSWESVLAHMLDAGDLDGALALIATAPPQIQVSSSVQLYNARALRRLGRATEARELLAGMSHGELVEEASYELGLLEFAAGKPAAAEAAFARASIGMQVADAEYGRALCLDRLGRASEAAAALETATAARPDFSEAWLQLGLLARYSLGDRPRACAAFETYFALGGDDPELRAWVEASQ